MTTGRLDAYLGSGVFASRPSTPSIPSNMIAYYYATDTFTLYAYTTGGGWTTIASNQNFIPSVALTKPLTSDFSSWQNQGGATESNDTTGMTIVWPTTPDANYRGRFKSLGANTIWTARIQGVIPASQYVSRGIAFRESGTGKMFCVHYTHDGAGFNLNWERYSSTTVRTSFASLFTKVDVMPWLRMRITGGNIICETSQTGDTNSWFQFYSVATTTPFTTTPDQCGFHCASNQTQICKAVYQSALAS